MPNNLEDIELRSEEVQEILTKVPNWMIRQGNTLFLFLIIMLLLLSWFIKYPDIIISDVIITTEIPPQKEYAKITGKIDTIFVSNGQEIKKNNSLAIIENTANYRDVLFLKSIIDTIKIQKENFSFPIEKTPILFLGDIETSYSL
ncbi:HlyD family secretion protein, partial [Tenacibaculum maritimum]